MCKIYDIKNDSSYDNESLYSVLGYALYNNSLENIRNKLIEYRNNSQIILKEMILNEVCIGIIVAEILNEIVIRNIGININYRTKGYGKKLIEDILNEFPNKKIVAETDSDAVGFYEHCGFEILPLGEKYPGVNRFQCIRQ